MLLPRSSEAGRRPAFDFNQRPLVVIWEVTRACALACRHCRAEANPSRHPLELTFEEGCRLMDQVRALDPAVFVLTGGDPFMRKDLAELTRYGTSIGLRISGSPSGTRLANLKNMQKCAEAGMQRVAFSLDHADEAAHDAFRGVQGSYRWTMEGIAAAKEAGLEIQIGTTVTQLNKGTLPAIARKVEELGVSLWSVFFLIPTGRAQLSDMLSPEEHEVVMEWLAEYSRTAPFPIKSTEGPHWRRVLLQKGVSVLPTMGVNDGKGFAFVSHIGDVHPSGFLPWNAGNIREQNLTDIYRNSDVFRMLRDPSQLKGKCGACEYKAICGGSRARAYGVYGDWLAEDPACAYVPAGYGQTAPVVGE
ncbi:MAG TPA: radical SAM protein [Symbiobacteriaceae bacterium]|jgi:AdoMet-dependent heme synthase|nr:radical SAM protein [Symbiobacteriaceae bacterium]